MALNVRETFSGLEHLRLAFCRRVLGMKPDAYMQRYTNKNIAVDVCQDPSGNPINCELCGFVMIKARFSSGWQLEMCSALPAVQIDSPAFAKWLTSLAANELNSSDCQLRDYEPILHE